MVVLTQLSLATVDQLFRYKAAGFTLPPFPGYSDDPGCASSSAQGYGWRRGRRGWGSCSTGAPW